MPETDRLLTLTPCSPCGPLGPAGQLRGHWEEIVRRICSVWVMKCEVVSE